MTSHTTGGTNLPNNGVVYLYPDKILITDTDFVLTNDYELFDNKFAQYNKWWYTVVII